MNTKINGRQLANIISNNIKRILTESNIYSDDEFLENIMVYDLIAKLGISESFKHELLSATLYNNNDEPIGKLNDFHVKYDPRDGRNGGLVGSF